MLTTLLNHTFQYGGQSQAAAKGLHCRYCFCPPSWKNDCNDIVSIDDISDQQHKYKYVVNRVKSNTDGDKYIFYLLHGPSAYPKGWTCEAMSKL